MSDAVGSFSPLSLAIAVSPALAPSIVGCAVFLAFGGYPLGHFLLEERCADADDDVGTRWARPASHMRAQTPRAAIHVHGSTPWAHPVPGRGFSLWGHGRR